jgi:hypothetical protein
MEYAVFCGDDLMSVFAAASFLQAVAIKNQLQALYNQRHNCDEVFHVRKATRAERRRMKEQTAGVVAFPKR